MWLSKERLEQKVSRVPGSSYQLELKGRWSRAIWGWEVRARMREFFLIYIRKRFLQELLPNGIRWRNMFRPQHRWDAMQRRVSSRWGRRVVSYTITRLGVPSIVESTGQTGGEGVTRKMHQEESKFKKVTGPRRIDWWRQIAKKEGRLWHTIVVSVVFVKVRNI